MCVKWPIAVESAMSEVKRMDLHVNICQDRPTRFHMPAFCYASRHEPGFFITAGGFLGLIDTIEVL